MQKLNKFKVYRKQSYALAAALVSLMRCAGLRREISPRGLRLTSENIMTIPLIFVLQAADLLSRSLSIEVCDCLIMVIIMSDEDSSTIRFNKV